MSFDSESGTLLSEALVNVDYKLNLAVEEGIINPELKKHIIKTAKSIYYPKRTYYNIFKKSELDEDTINKLSDFIVKIPDIKTLDAIDVLKYIKKLDDEN